MAKITKVPNGPLIKKTGKFKGSTLKNGGPVKKETNTVVKDKTSIPKPKTRGTIRNKPIYSGINPNATKKDSADYKKGYDFGVESPKNSDLYRGLSSNKSWNAGNEEGVKDKRPKKKISMKTGGMIKRADGSMSKRGLWDNLRSKAAQNKKTGAKPKVPTKQMLVQEKKIKAKSKK
jgi:hypothetical protein